MGQFRKKRLSRQSAMNGAGLFVIMRQAIAGLLIAQILRPIARLVRLTGHHMALDIARVVRAHIAAGHHHHHLMAAGPVHMGLLRSQSHMAVREVLMDMAAVHRPTVQERPHIVPVVTSPAALIITAVTNR